MTNEQRRHDYRYVLLPKSSYVRPTDGKGLVSVSFRDSDDDSHVKVDLMPHEAARLAVELAEEADRGLVAYEVREYVS